MYRLLVASTVLLATVAIAGCGQSSGSGPSKVGAPVSPVTLSLGDLDSGSLTPGLQLFVRQVNQLSHGAIVIKVETAPIADDQYETRILKETAAGKWDLAWIGGRSLDSVGVPSAGALQVPFLIDNYATERKVVLGSIGQQITRDMSKAGVVGLALLPDHLRYLVTREPIRSPADLKGKRIRVYGSSRSQIAAFRALGATPVPEGGNTTLGATLMKEGKVFGLESDPITWAMDLTSASTYTLGAPLWPRTDALFANPKRFNALPATTQNILREAAVRAAQQTGRTFAADDAAAVRHICQLGGHVTALDPAQIEAMTQAGKNSTRALPADIAPKAIVSEIIRLKGDTPPQAAPPIPAGCEPGTKSKLEPVAAGDAAQARALRVALAPGHVYRSRDDYNILARLGIGTAQNDAGTYTFRFSANRRFTMDQTDNDTAGGCFHMQGSFVQRGTRLATTISCPGQVIHERLACGVESGAIDCDLLFDDGGYPSSPKLGFEGMTQPLVPIRG
jgi:TRAP-type C4-dicarboxylate transport system substrate-binding protein